MTKKEYELVQDSLVEMRQSIIDNFDDMRNELEALINVEGLKEEDVF